MPTLEAFDAFDGGLRQVGGANDTANVFATYPKTFLSFGGGMLDQVVINWSINFIWKVNWNFPLGYRNRNVGLCRHGHFRYEKYGSAEISDPSICGSCCVPD